MTGTNRMVSKKPFLSLFHQVTNGIRNLHGLEVDTFTLMAVAVQESYGNPWFCTCDSLYKTNLRSMEEISGLTPKHFIGEITVRSGPNVNKIPKFRMEPGWYSMYMKEGAKHGLTAYQSAMFCCSFGMGQKGARFLVDKLEWADRIEYLKAFCASPEMQIVQMAKDLHDLHVEEQGNLKLALTRYNAGASAKRVSGYGVRVADLAAHFRKQYEAV